MRYKSKSEKRICLQCEIEDEAVDLVNEKIKEVKEGGVSVFGKNRAIQVLLCEYYKLRKAKGQSPA